MAEILGKFKRALSILGNKGIDDFSEKENLYVPPVYKFNCNPIVFLSGTRGSGKTSLLLTLMDYYRKVSTIPPYYGENSVDKNEAEKSFLNNIKDLRGRLIWLEPLDMEPLPKPINLLAAIFARIEDAVERFRKQGSDKRSQLSLGSHIEPNPHYQKVIMGLYKLQQDVALAWDGNIEERAASIDPDTFAVEVLRAERSRLRLNYRLRDILKKLSDTVFHGVGPTHNPLFVLPVDDFDLNPLRCIELLRLIRMISVPRLFILILGDIRIVQHITQLKVRNELTAVGSPTGIVPPVISLEPYSIFYRRPFSTIATETASNAVRKLIPPTHVIKLESVNVESGLDFHPDGESETLKDLFKGIPVEINVASIKETTGGQYVAGHNVDNLLAFFELKNIVDCQETDSSTKRVYCARVFFKLPQRHLQDLWLHIKQGSAKPSRSRLAIELANTLYKEAIREDPSLMPDMVEALIQAVKPDFEGRHQIDTENIIARNLVGSEIDVTLEGRSFVAHQAKDWHLGLMVKYGGFEPSITWLSERSEAALVILHDLLVLRRPRGIVGESLMKQFSITHRPPDGSPPTHASITHRPPDGTHTSHASNKQNLRWAYAKWDLGGAGIVKVPWHMPPWLSFWQCDLMRRGWNDTWFWLRKIEPELKDSVVRIADFTAFYLAYAWIKMGTIIISEEVDKNNSKMILPTARVIEAMSQEELGTTSIEKLKLSSKDNYQDKLKGMVPSLDEWLALIGQVSELTQCSGHYALKRELIHGWLVRIACMLAPESGIHYSNTVF